jgi:hypothetical protein
MAMDYLPIQSSAVPCERAFSSCAETNTLRRNCISPILMESLQMLKFGLRAEPFDFTSGLLTSEDELAPPPDDSPDFLAQLIQAGNVDASREDVMDKIIREMKDD